MPGNAAVNTEQEPFLGCRRVLPLQAALHGYNLRRVGVGQDAKADVLGAVPFIGGGSSCCPLGFSTLDQSIQCGCMGIDCRTASPVSRAAQETQALQHLVSLI